LVNPTSIKALKRVSRSGFVGTHHTPYVFQFDAGFPKYSRGPYHSSVNIRVELVPHPLTRSNPTTISKRSYRARIALRQDVATRCSRRASLRFPHSHGLS